MQLEFKKKALLTVLQAALVAGSFAAHAAEDAGTAPTPVTAPGQQKSPTAPAASDEGSVGPKPEPQARFLVKKGSGGAKTVGTAPEVRLRAVTLCPHTPDHARARVALLFNDNWNVGFFVFSAIVSKRWVVANARKYAFKSRIARVIAW